MTKEQDAEAVRVCAERLQAAAERMQTAIAFYQSQHGEESSKHLRVGINSAFANQAGLAALLMGKGVFTELEYITALASAMEAEAARCIAELDLPPNVTVGRAGRFPDG